MMTNSKDNTRLMLQVIVGTTFFIFVLWLASLSVSAQVVDDLHLNTGDGGPVDILDAAKVTSEIFEATGAVRVPNGQITAATAVIGQATTVIIKSASMTAETMFFKEYEIAVTAASQIIDSGTSFIELIPDADYLMTSVPHFANGPANSAQILYILNVSSWSLTFQDHNILAGSNFDGNVANTVLGASETMTLLWDPGESLWHVMSKPSVSAGAGSSAQTMRNTSGSSIAKHMAVYVSSYAVGQNVPEIALADADVSTQMPAIGVTLNAIGNNSNGSVITFGLVSSVSTAAWSATPGANGLYVSRTSGLITNTRPSLDSVQKIGICIRSHASAGVIFVVGAGRTNDTPNYISAVQGVFSAGMKSATASIGALTTTTHSTVQTTASGGIIGATGNITTLSTTTTGAVQVTATGGVIAATSNITNGSFTAIQLGSGNMVNEISTDDTLAAATNRQLVDAKTIKAYADSLSSAVADPLTLDTINTRILNATGLLTASGQIVATTITAEAANKLYLDSNGYTIIDDGWYTYGTTFNPGWGTDAAMIGYINFYSGHGGAGYYRDIGIGDGATYGYLMWIDGSDRFVGINRQTAVGTEDFGVNGDAYIGGDCSALTFSDRTPSFDGDALALINGMKPIDGKIDHSKLGPALVQKTIIDRFLDIKDKKTKVLIKRVKSDMPSHAPDIKDLLIENAIDLPIEKLEIDEVTTASTADYRDIGMCVSILNRSIQQLLAQNAALEARLAKLEAAR